MSDKQVLPEPLPVKDTLQRADRKPKLVARKCAYCAHPKGTIAFRYLGDRGETKRDYFHPGCFSIFLVEIEALERRK